MSWIGDRRGCAYRQGCLTRASFSHTSNMVPWPKGSILKGQSDKGDSSPTEHNENKSEGLHLAGISVANFGIQKYI